MGKHFQTLLLSIVVLLGLTVVIGIVLPAEWRSKRAHTVFALKAYVWRYVGDLSTWPEWVAWGGALDQEAVHTFEGTRQKGAVWSWDGPVAGRGRVEIIEYKPGHSVLYDLWIEGADHPVQGQILMLNDDGITNIEWTSETTLSGGPLTRLFGPALQIGVSRQLKSSMVALAEGAESHERR